MAKLGWIALAAAAVLVPAGALAAEDEGSYAPGSAVEAPEEGEVVAPGMEAEIDTDATDDQFVVVEEEDDAAAGRRRGPDEGVEVQLNGGLLTFPGESTVGNAATYGVGIGIEPLSLIGFEVGYQGVAYSEGTRLIGNDRDGTVGAVENGGYGVLKVSPFLGGEVYGIEPYALGGIAVSHLNVRENRGNADGQLQDDTYGKVPVGIGFDAHMGNFTAGLRGTYDFLFSNGDAFQSSTDRGDDQLVGTLHLGAQF